MGNIQAHSLNGRCHGILCILLVIVLGKEDFFIVKLHNFIIAGFNILHGIDLRELFHNSLRTFILKRRLDIVKQVIGQLIDNMDAAAVDIENYIKTI